MVISDPLLSTPPITGIREYDILTAGNDLLKQVTAESFSFVVDIYETHAVIFFKYGSIVGRSHGITFMYLRLSMDAELELSDQRRLVQISLHRDTNVTLELLAAPRGKAILMGLGGIVISIEVEVLDTQQ